LSDGYWDNHYQVVFLCTDFFAERDILLLCEALHTRFDLLAKPNKRITSTGKKCWRIRFSSEESNLVKLRSIVDPFILPLRRPWALTPPVDYGVAYPEGDRWPSVQGQGLARTVIPYLMIALMNLLQKRLKINFSWTFSVPENPALKKEGE
jgi:hypothetical protein